MRFSDLTMAASRAFHNVGFQLKKHSPEILVVTGVVGTVASAVLACKATTKVNFVLEETKSKVDIIHEGMEKGEVAGYLENGEVGMVPYTAEDSKKDLAIVYGQTGLKLAKLYGPAVLLGAASITSILVGHNILHKRNLAIAAAYTAVDNGFKQYRSRVVDRFDEKLDRELFYDIKAKEIEETVVDEDGKEKTVKKVIEVANPVEAMSPYTYCFDETATGWVRDAERNKFFLSQQMAYANDLLQIRGYMFVNDVLDMLGMQHTVAGQTVGWIYDKDNPLAHKPIDFGILNIHSEAARNFMNGYEKSVWITLNPEGNIMNELYRRGLLK